MTYNQPSVPEPLLPPARPTGPARRPRKVVLGSPELRRYAEDALPFLMAWASDGTVWLLNAAHAPLLRRDKTTGRWHRVQRTMLTPRVVTRVRLWDVNHQPWRNLARLHFLEHMLSAFKANHC